MSEDSKNSEIEKAKALIEEEKKARAKKAWEAIEKSLNENRCVLNFAIDLQGNRIPVEQVLKNQLVIIVQPVD